MLLCQEVRDFHWWELHYSFTGESNFPSSLNRVIQKVMDFSPPHLVTWKEKFESAHLPLSLGMRGHKFSKATRQRGHRASSWQRHTSWRLSSHRRTQILSWLLEIYHVKGKSGLRNQKKNGSQTQIWSSECPQKRKSRPFHLDGKNLANQSWSQSSTTERHSPAWQEWHDRNYSKRLILTEQGQECIRMKDCTTHRHNIVLLPHPLHALWFTAWSCFTLLRSKRWIHSPVCKVLFRTVH